MAARITVLLTIMNSSLQSSFAIFRKRPLLLAAPMLSAKVVTFALMTAVSSLNNHHFSIVRLPRPVPGMHVAPAVPLAQVSSQLQMLAVRGVISLTAQIAESMLEGFAIALTVVLATEMYWYGTCSLRSGMKKTKEVPSLGRIIFRFMVWCMLVLFMVGGVLALLLTIFMLVFHAGGAAHPFSPVSTSSSAWWIALSGAGIYAIVAYLLVPYFLELVLKLQRQPPPYDWVRQETAKPVLYFAWCAIVIMLAVGAILAHVNIAIAGGPVGTDTPLHLIQRLVAALIAHLPAIWFVVVAAVYAARVGQPVTDPEHNRVTS